MANEYDRLKKYRYLKQSREESIILNHTSDVDQNISENSTNLSMQNDVIINLQSNSRTVVPNEQVDDNILRGLNFDNLSDSDYDNFLNLSDPSLYSNRSPDYSSSDNELYSSSQLSNSNLIF